MNKIKVNLEWLFSHNNQKKDFVNYIIKKRFIWAQLISELITKLKMHKVSGIQKKFEKMGFSGDNSYLEILSKIKELEVGLFLAEKGEIVKFLEGQNSPDLISGIKTFNKIWEVKTLYDSPYISNLIIEGNKIIKSWNKNIVANIRLSLRLSGFIPNRSNHIYHKESIDLALQILRNFNPDSLNSTQPHILPSRDLIFELSQSTSNHKGIGTILEGGMERMAYLVTKEEELSWIEILRENLIKKSKQLNDDIKELEKNGKAVWDSVNYRFISLITTAYIFDTDYFKQACFGTFDLYSSNEIHDPRIITISPSNPWRHYIQDNCHDSIGRIIREPRGVFLNSDGEKLHGVLFISSNRTPRDHDLLLNPFVKINNNPKFIDLYK